MGKLLIFRNGFLTLCLLLIFMATSTVFAEGDEGYIYGKVTMDNGNSYQGIIRWGKEEAFWDDMFNSTKVDNAFESYLEDVDGLEDLEDDMYDSRRRRDRSIRIFNLKIWDDDWVDDLTHQFKCRFGDIQSMELRGSSSVLLTFKNGEELRISGGSNDIGARIRVYDDELDEVQLRWRRIDTIEFMATPKKLKRKFGNPLYGEVETRTGTYKGFIQWDHDECLSTDILDGDSEDGDMEIEFGNIQSIERYRRGSLVVLKSGRELYLTGSNDVNRENRGIIVKDPRFGKVLISWRDFDKIQFIDTEDSGPSYADFETCQFLAGTVKTRDGDTYTGRILYDFDEAFDLEILDGQDGDMEYLIPFRNIKKIVPHRRYGSVVELKSGEELELEDSRDVDDDNDGIVVWTGKKKVQYIPWRKIEEIVFE